MWLPSTSAFYASRRGGHEYRGWDAGRYALTGLLDAQNTANHMFIMANRDPKKGSKPNPPKPFPTPDHKKPAAPKPGSFAAIAASMMAAQRRKKEMLSGK